MTMKTLFLQAPSFDGFDGGAGSRYQAKREIRSFWYPTWLAQPAALVENSKLIDAPPHDTKLSEVVAQANDFDLVVAHTSARPALPSRSRANKRSMTRWRSWRSAAWSCASLACGCAARKLRIASCVQAVSAASSGCSSGRAASRRRA